MNLNYVKEDLSLKLNFFTLLIYQENTVAIIAWLLSLFRIELLAITILVKCSLNILQIRF